MRVYSSAVLASFLVGANATAFQKRLAQLTRNGDFPLDVVDQLAAATTPKMEAWMASKASSNNCTLENAAIRREWSDLSVAEREEYVQAVVCLQKLPAIAPKSQIPGALSHYDDWVATHMTRAGMLHSPTNLFASHRYYIWSFEKALRESCNYTGFQPYMNYDRYAADPINSSLFNGNSSSIGGNGGPSTYAGVPQPYPKPYNVIPSAGAGGCVTEGPFVDMVISLGPKSTVLRDVPKNPRSDGLGSNPRCLRRDVNKFSIAGATANYSYSLITENNDIDAFYNRYLGSPPLKNDPHPWGLHNAGHFTIGGGDPGADFYSSPGDPMFWFHHGALDRLWSIWQMTDPEKRVNLIPGSGAQGMNMRANVADTIVDLGWTAPPVKLGDLNDQLGGNGGQFCYVYL